MAVTTTRRRRTAAEREEIEGEVNRRVVRILNEKALEERLKTIDERLEENNHLRETLASKAYIDEKLRPIEEKLGRMVVVEQLGDGDFTVRFGDVVLGPEDLDELPEVTRASRAARESAAKADKAADRADRASTLKSLWVTAIASAVAAFVASLVAGSGLVWFLHVRGVL